MSAPDRLSRRRMIHLSMLGGGVLATAAMGAQCGETQIVTETKIQTVEVEKPVEKIVTKEVIKEVPVEKIVEKIVEKVVEKEKIVEKVVTVAASPAAPKVTTLVFWTPGGSAPYCEMFNEVGAEYSAIRQGVVKFEKVQCGTGEQNFLEVLLARVAAGNPPDATIFWDSPVSLAVRGAVVPLEDMLKTSRNSQRENWPDALIPSVEWQGKIHGLPVAAGTYAMFFNQQLFEKAGVNPDPEAFPKTWEELKEASMKLTRWKGDVPEQIGFGISDISQYELAIWSASNGSQIYDRANAKYTIDSPQNVEMMEFLANWIDQNYKGNWQKVTEARNWATYPDGEGRSPGWQDGVTAMVYSGAWFLGDMYNVAEVTFNEWDLGITPVGPSGEQSFSGFWPNWVIIPKGTKNVEEAFAWLDYLGMEGMPRWNQTVPDLPTNKNVRRELIRAPQVEEKRGRAFGEYTINFFYDMLDRSTPMWDSPVQGFATDQIKRAMDLILIGNEDAATSLGEAQKANQEQLEKVLKGGS